MSFEDDQSWMMTKAKHKDPNVQFITNHKGDVYKLQADPSEYYSAHRMGMHERRWSFKFDLCIQIGGLLFCINKDGTLVSGYNEFPKEELKKAYDVLSKTKEQR